MHCHLNKLYGLNPQTANLLVLMKLRNDYLEVKSQRFNSPESIRPLMPAKLTSDTVSDRGHELASQSKLLTQLDGKFLRAVLRFRHIPFKLVNETDVSNVYVKLESSSLRRRREKTF